MDGFAGYGRAMGQGGSLKCRKTTSPQCLTVLSLIIEAAILRQTLLS